MGREKEGDALDTWVTLVQTFGVAVACLGALGYAVWRVLVWTGTHVVLPVVQRHILFLDTMAAAVDKLVATLDRMAAKFDGVASDVMAVKSIVVRGDLVEVTAATSAPVGLAGGPGGTHPGR